jgi:arylsulfatase A-like enzyme
MHPHYLVIACVALLFVGCSDAQRPEAWSSPQRHIAVRVDASQFENLPATFHGAVVRIGDEARPALQAPGSKRVASVLNLESSTDGFVQGEIDLPVEVRDLPGNAFSLQAQRLPIDLAPEMVEHISRTVLSRHITTGWQLIRDSGGRSVLRFAHGDPVGAHRYSLHLFVLESGRAQYRSRTFEAPPHATLELAYGMVAPAGGEGRVSTHFGAALQCEGESSRLVIDRMLDPSEEAGWRDVSVALPESGASCRLDLSAKGPEGEPVRGTVWGVPQVSVAAMTRGSPLPNVVMISLDTLRADHLSGFGYPRATSPRIDSELIARGTSFHDVSSTYSRTDVSHMSLFSGLYPDARPDPGRIQADSPVPLLAERLRDAGYQTSAFTEDALLAGTFGFWFGFDRFRERAYRHEDRGVGTFEDGIDYVRASRDRRFFLFLHTYKTHDPYVPDSAYATLFDDPSEWNEEGMGPIPGKHRAQANAYDRTIREADDLVGDFLAELEALGLAAHTLVILVSDHGEAFGEHGLTGHSFSSQQEVIRVPVVFRGPGVPAGLHVDTPTSLVDVAPTILDLLGLAPLEVVQGISLAPAFRGERLPAARPLFFSWFVDEAVGVRRGQWKYRRDAGRSALFDLDRDPIEMSKVPLSAAARSEWEHAISKYRAESAALREAFMPGARVQTAPVITEETERSLRALGYVE